MLDERDREVLCAIVQSYINNPDPVGSRFITKKYAFCLSPATIRNIMSDLEDMGFLRQPHTSAGRVPTDKGYRFYVDCLSSHAHQYENKVFLNEITRELKSIKNDVDILLSETIKRLSNFSHYLGVALSPMAGSAAFNRIELLKHGSSHVVTVLFTDEGLVKNKVVDVDFDLPQRDLNRIASYLNSEFYGCTLNEIRSRIVEEMSEEKILCDTLISRSIKICREALSSPYGDIFISGFSEVLGLPDFSDVEKIKEISKAIEDKHLIIKLLDKLSESNKDEVQVIIGSENSLAGMKGFSLVAATYKEGSRRVGSVGVIGPTRMDYSKTMAMIDIAARFITKTLEER
ncbi:MAG: heat-inducible transcription repressor HrcA [Nitrospirae bacterium CG_4_10_14_3_um_filter_44_29]|nr:heat-inducible transcription repressor HrcA [Nitrospirota bacterium]OIO32049.1 MAG: heat-inducible transcription repressor HrcA [Nitrospirae bacterium CG1_02_44_142]PIP70721.1 MAG: heat-inducible transcription repressor HrcA [Nitrospirae bacterium CG22_combo_CG10-13_8_21_14_all_44_11]PIV41719.1 MAG: heat-inducible transcription repressor HrcA [Nitrospirae bacterium CG02_land_8_20_14_3_00_44_33]PIW89098.1 MAG: heat-inducible transcription repressor HrcA [Nitrospirae bacterium CG_4_8_14_3_um_f